MINKVCYTYWTNSGKKYNCGFRKFDIFLNFFKISIKKSQEYFDNVVIYTDQEGCDKLNPEISGVTYEVVDYSTYNFDERFWNFPKIITYSMQNEPFIHIDCDAVFIENPGELTSGVVTEKTRGTLILKKDVFPLLPPEIKKHVEIICSGLLGGNNIEVFKDLLEIAEDSIIERDFDKVNFNNLVAIEEIALTHLVHRDEISFEELSSDCFIHFQGALKNNVTLEDVINVDTIKNKYLILKDK